MWIGANGSRERPGPARKAARPLSCVGRGPGRGVGRGNRPGHLRPQGRLPPYRPRPAVLSIDSCGMRMLVSLPSPDLASWTKRLDHLTSRSQTQPLTLRGRRGLFFRQAETLLSISHSIAEGERLEPSWTGRPPHPLATAGEAFLCVISMRKRAAFGERARFVQ
jgi:hypothetical protein